MGSCTNRDASQSLKRPDMKDDALDIDRDDGSPSTPGKVE
jgi:hypothetical protein